MLVAQTNGLTGLILTSNVGTCTQTNNQVTCTAGNMPGFSNWRVTIRGTVTAANGTTLFNGVTVTANHESSGYETAVFSQVLVSNTTHDPEARPADQRPGSRDHRRRHQPARHEHHLPAHGQQLRRRQRGRRRVVNNLPAA